jgi:hypothetical protein
VSSLPPPTLPNADGRIAPSLRLKRDYPWPDDEDVVCWLERRDEERAARSDAQWWEEDHLGGQTAERLTQALDHLVQGCACEVGRLLSDLREIERLSDGYNFFLRRRELPGIITRTRSLARDFERIEMSPLCYSLPAQMRGLSEALSQYADVLEKARQATRRTRRPDEH